MRINLFAVFILCLLLSNLALAQNARKQLKGITLVQNSGDTIRLASIRNIYTGNAVISRHDGSFLISVSKGNILSVGATGFYSDTLTVSDSVMNLSILEIRLRPLPATLPGAVVSARYNSYQIDSIERRKNFLATVGEAKIPTVSRANDLGFGVGINLDHFYKREKNKRNARGLFDITEEEAYINYRWNDSVVIKYTHLRGDSLTEFMQAYRPTWEWLRQNADEEDLLYYINKSLKKYYKRPGE